MNNFRNWARPIIIIDYLRSQANSKHTENDEIFPKKIDSLKSHETLTICSGNRFEKQINDFWIKDQKLNGKLGLIWPFGRQIRKIYVVTLVRMCFWIKIQNAWTSIRDEQTEKQQTNLSTQRKINWIVLNFNPIYSSQRATRDKENSNIRTHRLLAEHIKIEWFNQNFFFSKQQPQNKS